MQLWQGRPLLRSSGFVQGTVAKDVSDDDIDIERRLNKRSFMFVSYFVAFLLPVGCPKMFCSVLLIIGGGGVQIPQ
jgi:hypothetical protein